MKRSPPRLSSLPRSSPNPSSSSSSSPRILRPAPPPTTSFGTYRPLYPSSSPSSYQAQPPSFPAPLPVPSSIPRPHYVPPTFFSSRLPSSDEVGQLPGGGGRVPKGGRIKLGGLEEAKVRRAAGLASRILKEAGEMVKPGITTAEIDAQVHSLIIHAGAYPSPLGYKGFPKSVCTSVNNVIAHGIPDDRPLHSHDIVNVDVTVFLDGYHGDTSATFLLPEADDQAMELAEVTKEALEAGINVCGVGVPLNEIGRAIEKVADRYNLVVCDLFTGHQIGTLFHFPPFIDHIFSPDPPASTTFMELGQSFTIEPSLESMFVGEGGEIGGGMMWGDGWTVVTAAGQRSAQFEHQLLITENGAEVLTR